MALCRAESTPDSVSLAQPGRSHGNRQVLSLSGYSEIGGRPWTASGLGELAPAAGRSVLADGANDFTVELERLGYMEGRNLVLDWRLVTSAERNAALAAELVAAKPDILLAAGSQQVEALKRATA